VSAAATFPFFHTDSANLLRVWGKFSLAVFLLAVTARSARAGSVTVNKGDGVNFGYSAVDTNGILVVTFSPTNFVTRINNSLKSPSLPASFHRLTLSPTFLTDDIPGLSGHFIPNLNSTHYGISSLMPASSNVVFDYSISFGQAAANGLTITGTIALDPASGTTFTQGTTTYNFSRFKNFSLFTLSLGTQDATGVLIYNVLKSGNGTFSGTAQFNQFAPPPAALSTVPDTE
jgi:hypothetical protein